MRCHLATRCTNGVLRYVVARPACARLRPQSGSERAFTKVAGPFPPTGCPRGRSWLRSIMEIAAALPYIPVSSGGER